jgi:hypothetical protein
MSYTCAAATQPIQVSPASTSTVIQVSPESSFLDLNSTDHTAALRQTSTPVRITVADGTTTFLHPIEVYACVTTEEAMRLAGKSPTLALANLHIRNDREEWTALEPMANSASARFLLQVQLRVPASQEPGTYQGVLTLEAMEQ